MLDLAGPPARCLEKKNSGGLFGDRDGAERGRSLNKKIAYIEKELYKVVHNKKKTVALCPRMVLLRLC